MTQPVEQSGLSHDSPTLTGNELRDGGYLQEANRVFFHPLGLALAVDLQTDQLSVIDYRSDPEGVTYCRIDPELAHRNAEAVLAESIRRATVRQQRFGWVLQPVPSMSDDCP